MLLAKKFRQDSMDANGQIGVDNVTRRYLPPPQPPVPHRNLAVWWHPKIRSHCMALRGDCVGLGGGTLASFVEGGVVGNFTWLPIETWMMGGVEVLCDVVLGSLAGKEVVSAGGDELVRGTLTKLLAEAGLEQYKTSCDEVSELTHRPSSSPQPYTHTHPRQRTTCSASSP